MYGKIRLFEQYLYNFQLLLILIFCPVCPTVIFSVMLIDVKYKMQCTNIFVDSEQH